ncbi:MAG: YebC/PmpR family DNA-binding transcriptional regulator [Chloroflexi bacterium]|nr:YebC/PmpR family DNA-binding transcriptional regulator [Chloroflexota bacterium]
MSGHSKWSTIKRQKAASDARKGQLFTKLSREIILAARQGGGDLEANFRLRLAVDKARAANMPKDSIERAIKRGTGELKEAALEEMIFEAYAPHGVALILSVLTDNRNRAVADIRRILTRAGGNMGETGSVTWLFDQKGLIISESSPAQAEDFALLAIDAGAEDVRIDDGLIEVYTSPSDLPRVKESLEKAQVPISSAELTRQPKTRIQLGVNETLENMQLIEFLEGLEDVQQVWSNIEIPDEALEKYQPA